MRLENEPSAIHWYPCGLINENLSVSKITESS